MKQNLFVVGITVSGITDVEAVAIVNAVRDALSVNRRAQIVVTQEEESRVQIETKPNPRRRVKRIGAGVGSKTRRNRQAA